MKCKYRFKITGFIAPDKVLPIRSQHYLWEFEIKDGLLTYISATVALKDKNDWPSISPSQMQGVKIDVNIKASHLPFIQTELRTIQGLLSLSGLRSIDIQHPEVEWISESEEEKSALRMYSFKESIAEPTADSILPTPFDELARIVLAANKAYEIEVPLSFFRHGLNDVYEGQFIEAIYDFYFVLETMFAEGAFKSRDVCDAFGKSSELCSAINKSLSDPGPTISFNARLCQSYRAKIGKMTVLQYIEHIIALRGFLHHHTQRRKGIWNPERQEQYEIDALFLQSVAFIVLFDLTTKYLYDPEVIHMYRESMKHAQGHQG